MIQQHGKMAGPYFILPGGLPGLLLYHCLLQEYLMEEQSKNL